MQYKKYFSEFIGTFILVLLGTGSIILSEEFEDSFNGFTIALVTGITVTILIYFLGKFSDCHINPAITITFMIYKELSFITGLIYIFMQILGAIFASIIWNKIFSSNLNLGNTIPKISETYTFILEFLMSGIIIFAILFSTLNIKKQNLTYLIVGVIIFFEAWLGGPFTGASMNPARTIGPSLISGNCTYLWIYISAPITGMLVFYKIYKIFF